MNILFQNLRVTDLKEDFITFPLYIISRPFKGFSDLKYENRGKLYFAITMMVLMCLFNICDETYRGFVLTGYYMKNKIINTPYIIVMTIAPAILFIVSNWCVTAVTDGNGAMKQILMVYAYASYPRLFLNIIGLILSNLVTAEEAAFSIFFYSFGMVAFLFYLFVGLIVIHEYSFTKALLMVVLTVGAMCIIVFVLALFMALSNEVITFFSIVFKELTMRL